MRLGVFGGSFNPIHLGHLLVADDVRRQLGLDRILFVPAANPPHRRDVLVRLGHRLRMVELALAEVEAAGLGPVEETDSGPSYTVRTLELLRRRASGASLYLILGADQYAAVRTWHRPRELTRLARIVVMSRPGVVQPRLFSGHARSRVRFLDVVPVDIAAACVRVRLRAGCSVRCLLPTLVAAYIRKHRLYRDAESRAGATCPDAAALN